MDSTNSLSFAGTGSFISVIYPPGEPKSLFPGGVASTAVGETPKSLTKESTGTLPETLTRPLADGVIPSEDTVSFTRAIPSDVRQDLRSRMLIFIGALIISPQFLQVPATPSNIAKCGDGHPWEVPEAPLEKRITFRKALPPMPDSPRSANFNLKVRPHCCFNDRIPLSGADEAKIFYWV